MRTDCSKWARECLGCQRSKVIRHTVPPIGEFEVPNKRFDHVNIDLVTLPPSNGFRYLLTIVDRFTRWPVAVPLVDATTQSVLDGFSYGWVQSFGIPHTVTSDRGTQFTSATFQQLSRIWGIRTITTTAYHPEANGLVERFHRRLKEAIIALGSEDPEEWFWRLPMVMLTIRTTLKPDVGASPADLVYGEGLAVPGEALPSNPATDAQLLRQRAAALADMRLEVARMQPVQTSAHRRPLVHIPEALESCSHVFIRRGGPLSTLESPYVGPYKVLDRNNVNFKVAVPGRTHQTFAIGRIKPAYVAIEDAEEARPPTPPPPPSPPVSPAGSQGPNRRRSRRRRSENQDPPMQPHPQSSGEVVDDPLTFDFPHDNVPDWAPPDWFDVDADPDAAFEEDRPDEAARPQAPASQARPQQHHPPEVDPDDAPELEVPAPPPAEPPPPPRTWSRKRQRQRPGNPNWVKGGNGVGRRNNRPRPDVTAIYSHLGFPSPSPVPFTAHQCSIDCNDMNTSL